eukprot:TRINITY_DN17631_c0_g1_i1.p1 TRINITY_DN17631_c0_g1~~TRINITY_DN17631_c0_g1_i1.p1  ORF type:complete len:217 (-),score=11.55 TRINITY_DN17631_c0_g1_i1:5-655(-)
MKLQARARRTTRQKERSFCISCIRRRRTIWRRPKSFCARLVRPGVMVEAAQEEWRVNKAIQTMTTTKALKKKEPVLMKSNKSPKADSASRRVREERKELRSTPRSESPLEYAARNPGGHANPITVTKSYREETSDDLRSLARKKIREMGYSKELEHMNRQEIDTINKALDSKRQSNCTLHANASRPELKGQRHTRIILFTTSCPSCLLYTSDAADE